MVEAQDKPVGLAPNLVSDRRITGSVPAVIPKLLSSRAMASVAALAPSLYDEIASLLLIVLIPAAFWCGVIIAVRSLFGLETSSASLSCIGLVIAGFLLIIRASLVIDRSAKPD